MKYYRLFLNFDQPLGEIEIRRTLKNLAYREKSLEINWDRNYFMPSEQLSEGEFSLTDESKYLDILKVSHLGWEGMIVNARVLEILEKFKLQIHRKEKLIVYKNNDEQQNYNLQYCLIHFHSNASFWIEKIYYSRTSKKSGGQQSFEVSYKEFIESEINIPIKEKIFRKIRILKIEYLKHNFPNGFFDLFYNTFLFNTDFIVSGDLRNSLIDLSGFSFEEGPMVVEV